MTRKTIIFLIIGVLAAALAALGYFRWTEARKKIDLWTLVPADAVLIWESNRNTAFLDHLKDTPVWQTLSQFRYLQKAQETVQVLDSVGGGPGNSLQRFLGRKQVLISLHVVSNTDFDFVYYVPINNVREHRYVRSLTENLEKTGQYTFEARQFLNYEVTDVRNKQTGQELSYFSYHNNLVLSANASLIEQVIRKIERDELVSPLAAYKSKSYLAQPKVWANLFVNFQQVPVFLSLFVSEEVHQDLAFLFSLCRNGLLELKLDQNQLFLNGISQPDTARGSLYRQLEPKKAVSLGMRHLITSRTAVLVHLAHASGKQLMQPRKKAAAADAQADALADSLRSVLEGEVAICWLEAFPSSKRPEKVVIVQTKDPGQVESLLRRAGDRPGSTQNGRGRHLIHLTEAEEFPQRLLGTFFSGFEQTYFTQLEGYLVMTENLPALQALLSDIDNEAVWGKSVEQKAFLEQTQQEAEQGIFVNTANSWSILTRYLEPVRQEDLVKNASLLKRFTQAALQFSAAEGSFYTSYLLQHEARPGQETHTGAFLLQNSITLPRGLISQPFLVRNPAGNTPEVLVQDSAFLLHLVTADGKRLWSDSLSEPVLGQVYQAELQKAAAPQYVFATASRIYAADREGRILDNFPFNLPDSVRLQHLAVAEGGRTEEPTLLADDFRGNVYRFNTRGELLEGWSPRQLGARLAVPVQSLVVGGQQVLVAVLDNGTVYALNQYGEPLSGFPVTLEGGVKGGAFLRQGASLRKSQLTLAVGSGTLVTVNLLGEVVKRDQLLKLSRSSRFELVPDAAGLTYVLVRQDLGKLTIFDPDLKPVLEKSYVTSAPKLVQYFNFGADQKLYAVIEKGPRNTYLYNHEGILLGKKPFENVAPISLLPSGSGRNYEFYSISKNRLRKVSVPVR